MAPDLKVATNTMPMHGAGSTDPAGGENPDFALTMTAPLQSADLP